MTLQSLPRQIYYPWDLTVTGWPVLANGATLDASGEYDSIVYCAQEDMTISHVGVRVATATNSPTADIRIETVATDGLPSGTLWATNTNIVTGVLSTGWAIHALTASATITKGQMFCVKVLWQTATSILVINVVTNTLSVNASVPYRVVNTGTPTKATSGNNSTAVFVLGSSSTTYYNIPRTYPINSSANNAFNNTSSARRGVRFQVPFKCRVIGFQVYLNTASGDYNAILFDDGGTELGSSSTAFDGNQSANWANPTEQYFGNVVTLDAATWYRLALEPSSATNTSITTLVCSDTNYIAAMPGGANFFYTTYVASSWTDTATGTVPLMSIIIDQIDDGVSAGGGGGLKLAGRGGLAG